MAGNPGSGIPSWSPIVPSTREAYNFKSKQNAPMEIPGLIYNQYVPTAATVTSGTVTNNGLSLIAANQLGTTTAGTLPLGGTAAVTFSSSGGLLASFTTSSFMPTTLNYDQYPVVFTPAASAVLPTGIVAGVEYYWQWVSATTGNICATPNGTKIAYTDAGSGTIYCQAASAALGVGYYGSPTFPAGFFQAAEGIGSSLYNASSAFPGTFIRCEIRGHRTGTTTNSYTVMPGLISGAGTWTALSAGNALAATATGPFPFRITTDIIIQQYGSSAVTSPYTAIGMVKCMSELQSFSTTSTNTWSTGIWAKTVSLDLTQSYTLDVRYIAATPAVGEYLEPLECSIWAYN